MLILRFLGRQSCEEEGGSQRSAHEPEVRFLRSCWDEMVTLLVKVVEDLLENPSSEVGDTFFSWCFTSKITQNCIVW